MRSAMHALGGRALRLCLSAALVMAAAWPAPANAQADTSRPGTTAPAAGASPPTAQSTKTVPDLHLQTLTADPCKAKNPPAYCAKK